MFIYNYVAITLLNLLTDSFTSFKAKKRLAFDQVQYNKVILI